MCLILTLVSWQTTLSQQKLVDCNTVLYGSYFAFAGITNTILCPVRPFRHNLTSNSTAATAISSRFVFDFPRDRDIIEVRLLALRITRRWTVPRHCYTMMARPCSFLWRRRLVQLHALALFASSLHPRARPR